MWGKKSKIRQNYSKRNLNIIMEYIRGYRYLRDIPEEILPDKRHAPATIYLYLSEAIKKGDLKMKNEK